MGLDRIKSMSPEEQQIWNKMLDYDDKYFSDMRFEKKEILNKFAKIQFKDVDGKFKAGFDDFPLQHEIPMLDTWSIKIGSKRMKAEGSCNKKQKIIKIKKGLKNNELKRTLLHEIIHVYESLSEKTQQNYAIYRQFLCLYLYEKLKNKIGLKKLKKILETGLHFTVIENLHTPLFLLKSLDLDLKLKIPLGTIHSYEREDFFKSIKIGR